MPTACTCGCIYSTVSGFFFLEFLIDRVRLCEKPLYVENDQKIRDGPDEGLDREIVFAV